MIFIVFMIFIADLLILYYKLQQCVKPPTFKQSGSKNDNSKLDVDVSVTL